VPSTSPNGSLLRDWTKVESCVGNGRPFSCLLICSVEELRRSM
jgi:hypothetical protein